MRFWFRGPRIGPIGTGVGLSGNEVGQLVDALLTPRDIKGEIKAREEERYRRKQEKRAARADALAGPRPPLPPSTYVKAPDTEDEPTDLKSGFVYVIRNNAGHVKIGRSTNPLARLRALQTGSPHRLELAYVIALETFGERIEREAHASLSRHAVGGEWFNCPEAHAVAVVTGIAHQSGEKFIQVPPELIPAIIQKAREMG